MKKLTVEYIIKAHSLLIAQTGGSDGIRDVALIDSAVNTPFHTFGGRYLYPSIEMKAAMLGFSLVKNHPFIDGNKRIGVLAMIMFLEINGYVLNYTDEELAVLGFSLADGSINYDMLLKWILAHLIN